MSDVIIDVPLGTTATQLQTMINAAGSGTTFRLQAGTYTFDKTVIINKDFVSLIGAGSDQTTIIAAASLKAAAPIQVGHALYKPIIEDTVKITAPALAGDTTLQLESGHGLQVGDVIYIAAQNTTEFFNSIGDTDWQKTNPLRTLMVEVTSVSGNQIGFNSPLTFDYDPTISFVEKRTVLEGNTLAGFTVTGAYGTPDPSSFSNVISGGKGAISIMIGGTNGMTVSDIAILNAVSSGLLISNSIDMTLTGFSMNGAHNKGIDGNGYALWLREVYDSSFTDLSIVDTRHAVVFASYTTESGNQVEVVYTNRDINFHGGRDQYNVVVVDTSIRTPEEQAYMSTATFFNPGTFYGAPTDPTKNAITFKNVVASNKNDTIYSHVEGSSVFTVAGNDTVHSGAGNDVIDGGLGTDLIYASGGNDTIQGGGGTDRIVFANALTSYELSRSGDTLIVTNAQGTTRVTGVENLSFGNASYSMTALLASVGTGTPPNPDGGGGGVVTPPAGLSWAEMDTTGLTVVNGISGYDKHTTASSFLMGTALDGASLTGSENLIVVGNGLANTITGNTGANRIEGRGGNDKLYGGSGNDTLIGGDGNDSMYGSSGNDAIAGGAGNDRSEGQDGDDLFHAGSGVDTVIGGTGSDTLILTGELTEYTITQTSSGFLIAAGPDRTSVSSVEAFLFNGTAYLASGLMQAYLEATGGGAGGGGSGGGGGIVGTPWEEIDATGMIFVNGASGYQRHNAYASFAMGNDLEATRLYGTENLIAIGNSLDNAMRGNDGSNRLEGRGGNDTIRGSDGNDTLVGGTGNDSLNGGDENDVLSGGFGNDRMKGGDGLDSFVFLTGYGQDVITDFEIGEDSLMLGVAGFTMLADLTGIGVQIGGDLRLDFGGGNTLLIEDVTLSEITGDIIFV